jgi:rare lipoprotein A (peptidoglycan hydrolase)
MKNLNLISALILCFASLSHAAELGHANATQHSNIGSTTNRFISVTARERIPTPTSGQVCRSNAGICSLLEIRNALTGASREATRQEGLRNIALTNKNRNLNLRNLNGCHLIAQGRASCYGTPKDGFGYAKDKLVSAIGIPFHPENMSAACSPSLKGKIVVVRDVTTNQARAVTCTDTGAFQTKYGRIIDLAREAFNAFGPRCDQAGILKNVELYTCPRT